MFKFFGDDECQFLRVGASQKQPVAVTIYYGNRLEPPQDP